MNTKKLLLILASVSMLTSCNIDAFPEGSTITEEQNNAVVADRPELLRVSLNAMNAIMTQIETFSTSDNFYHYDFGVPSINLMTDVSGQDMVCQDHGYNWYSSPLTYGDRTPERSETKFIWKMYYSHIKAANDVIATVIGGSGEDASTYDDQSKNYIGQAYASRAFDYLQLIQLYQFTYSGHESALGLPIVTETTTVDDATNNPRATVQEVYDLIISDLNKACEYMSDAPMTRADKTQITAEVAYGLRARANLLMNNWSDAITDAEKAMVGASVYTITELGAPKFYDANDNSWIWGLILTTESASTQTGICNITSMLSSLTGMGYTTAIGMNVVQKCITSTLWNTISDTDVRKGWWLDENNCSPLIGSYGYGTNSYADLFGSSVTATHTNVKFGPSYGEVGNSDNETDWPLMRVEEMILIKAEAQAQMGDGAAAAATLKTLMANRDPEWNEATVTVDDVWNQRRIELWGEGFSLQDVLRLKKPFDRTVCPEYPATANFRFEAESAHLLYNIPIVETETNSAITDVNEIMPTPTPVM